MLSYLIASMNSLPGESSVTGVRPLRPHSPRSWRGRGARAWRGSAQSSTPRTRRPWLRKAWREARTLGPNTEGRDPLGRPQSGPRPGTGRAPAGPDPDPGSLRETRGGPLQRDREADAGGVTGQGAGHDRPRGRFEHTRAHDARRP